MAAAWPTIGERTTPMNTTGAAPANGGPAPVPGNPAMGIPSISATRSTIAEVIFDPESQSNPFFLHPNESPALVLVSTPLDGSNYHPWARAMTMALSCKNKLKFVDGSILKPPKDDRKFEVWGRCNDMVVTWIVRSLSPTIGRSVLWIDTAYGIWRDLKRRFSQQDLFRIAEIKCEIYQTKQGDGSLNEYFTQQKLLWDELQILRPTVSCECTLRCECGSKIDQLNEQVEKDKLSIFLIGLHDRYTGARNQIMLMRPLPDVCDAYSMIAQQERQFHIGNTGFNSQLHQVGENGTSGSVLMSRAAGSSQQNFKRFTGNKKPTCTFCGYTGHTEDKCYRKHGFPPGWKSKPRSQGSVNQAQGPLIVQQQASDENTSFTHNDFKRFMEFVQIHKSCGDKGVLSSPLDQEAQVNTISANIIPRTQTEGTSSSLNLANHKQYKWILDSGATHHIVCCINLLTDKREVHDIHVSLPNGQKVSITCIGSVYLSKEFVLHNVLYVPGFQYNLISVGAFVRSSRCTMSFHTNQCMIQGTFMAR
ncbi:PREDICTED: uncharacterized protein LOC109150247 [Ipomoea nil]|uniref:uncharacterized protein LOC109150247 n=1 Tax=Ipomoea nil TaxID=35883 RepID=UPI000901A587|nr:PREDICTED: uncharacterized protein LOC109150247 [Ipomoea nil]